MQHHHLYIIIILNVSSEATTCSNEDSINEVMFCEIICLSDRIIWDEILPGTVVSYGTTGDEMKEECFQ
jgi:hypothetical protein